MKKSPSTTFKAGELVTIQFGGRPVSAEIVEDRGPLGPRGMRLFHVEIPTDASEPILLQLAEDELEEHRPPPLPSREEVKQYLLDGGLTYMLRYGNTARPPRIWMYRNNAAVVAATTTSVSRRGEIGGAEVPLRALKRGKIFAPKVEDVVEFVRSFGLTRAEAADVVQKIGLSS